MKFLTLALSGLGENEIEEFVHENAQNQPKKTVVRALYNATEGNPFFLKEIVRLLASEGRLNSASDSFLESFRIPNQIGSALRRRLALVSPNTRSLLSVASSIGREFDLRLLSEIAHISQEQALSNIDEAVKSNLIIPTVGIDEFRVAHALFAEAVYEDIPRLISPNWKMLLIKLAQATALSGRC
jgi:predicted ATPase